MTRLAFDLGGWETRDYRGEAPLTEAAIEEHQATFLNARLWDYRPLGDTLDQLQTIRQYYDFVDVDTDRYPLGDETRQVMLSVRELDAREEPGRRRLGQRADHLHPRHRRRDGPGKRGRTPGPAAARDPGPAARLVGGRARRSRSRASTSASAQSDVRRRRRPAGRVRLSARADGDRRRRGRRDTLAGTTGNQARHDPVAPAVRAPLPRPQLADQRPDHERQPAPVPPLAERIGCRGSRRSSSTTRIRTSSFSDDGRLVYIQDAYTATDRFPHAQPFNPGELNRRARSDRARRAVRSTTSGTASRSSWTPTTAR